MRVCLVHDPRKRHQGAALAAMADGMRSHGLSVDLGDAFTESDLTVVWGARTVPDAAERVLRLEAGYINGQSGEYVRDRLRFVSVSWGQLHGRGVPPPLGCPPDRWDALNIELEPWVERDGVLICLNHPHDSQAPPSVTPLWYSSFTPAYIRPHPLISPSQESLKDALARVGSCVVWNSGACIEAVIRGVPTTAVDRGAMVRVPQLGSLHVDTDEIREKWAHQLAYRQWTHAELSSGEAWEFTRYGMETNLHDDGTD